MIRNTITYIITAAFLVIPEYSWGAQKEKSDADAAKKVAKQVQEQVNDNSAAEPRIDRSSPIIFARSELMVFIKEMVPVQLENTDSEEKKNLAEKKEVVEETKDKKDSAEKSIDDKAKPKEEAAKKPEEAPLQKFIEEVRQVKLMVDVKTSETFFKEDEAFIDTGAYTDKTGTLIVFPKFGKHPLPLANLQSAADFVFMDRQGYITEIAAKIIPGALEDLISTKPSYAVLVLSGGATEKLKLKPADRITHKVLQMPSEMLEISGHGNSKRKNVFQESPVIFNSNK